MSFSARAPEPARLVARRTAGRRRVSLLAEAVIETLVRVCGISAVLFVLLIFYFIFREAKGFVLGPGFHPVEFFTSPEWYPDSVERARYGTLALVAGTGSVTLLAMLIAVPLGLGAAIYISEFSAGRTREVLKVTTELLAAIPSVVWGFIGMMIMNPLIIRLFDAPIGLNVLNGGIILAFMAVPPIVSIGEDALKAVPDAYRQAAEAMGATRWQIVWRVLLPAAKNGLLAAVLLGVGRAIGETMAVLMATGHAVQIPHGPLDSVRTLTATIAAELGEAPRGGEHYRALFTVGLLLFAITFTVNLTADLFVRGVRRR